MTKNRLAPTQLALLLILMELEHAYAWQIKKILEKRGFEFWVDIKKSIIYKSLGILEEKMYISGIKEEEGVKLSKKNYTITDAGKTALIEQIALCISDPPISKNVFDLGIAGIQFLTKEKAILSLEAYLSNLNSNIQWFKSILDQFNNIDEIVLTDPDRVLAGSKVTELQKSKSLYIIRALFDRPYHIILAQRDWISKFLLDIKNDTDGKMIFTED